MPTPPITPNMNLTEPIVGSTISPTWALDLNADLTLIDQHNHTPGQGVQIPPAGLDINSNLTFNYNSLIDLNSLVFAGTVSGTTVPLSLFTNGTDLFYEDVHGNTIQLTKSGGPNAGTGNIQGLPSTPVGAAGISWVNGSSTFDFLLDSGMVGANIAIGSLALTYTASPATPTSMQIVVEVPSAISGYTLTLPAAVPSSTSFLQMDSGGNVTATIPVSAGLTTSNLSASAGILGTQLAANTITTSEISNTAGITGTQIASQTVGVANLAPSGIQVLTFASTSTTSTSPTVIGALIVPIYTSPAIRPVLITLGSAPSGGQSYFRVSNATAQSSLTGFIQVTNTTSGFSWITTLETTLNAANALALYVPPSITIWDRTANSGSSIEYDLFISVTSGTSLLLENVQFSAVQL